MNEAEIREALAYYRNIAQKSKTWPVRFSFTDGRFHCACGAVAYEERHLEHGEGCLYLRMEAIYNPGGKP